MNKKNVSPNNDPESKSVAFVMLWFHFFSMVDAAMRYFFLSSFRRFFRGKILNITFVKKYQTSHENRYHVLLVSACRMDFFFIILTTNEDTKR